MLFKVANVNAKPVGFSKITNEKELQDLVEKNLPEISGLTLLSLSFGFCPSV